MKTPIIATLAFFLSAGAASAQTWQTPAAANAAQRVLTWPSISQAEIAQLATPTVKRVVEERGLPWLPDMMTQYVGKPTPIVLPPDKSGAGYEPYIESCGAYTPTSSPTVGFAFEVLLTYRPILGYRATVMPAPAGDTPIPDVISCAQNQTTYAAQ